MLPPGIPYVARNGYHALMRLKRDGSSSSLHNKQKFENINPWFNSFCYLLFKRHIPDLAYWITRKLSPCPRPPFFFSAFFSFNHEVRLLSFLHRHSRNNQLYLHSRWISKFVDFITRIEAGAGAPASLGVASSSGSLGPTEPGGAFLREREPGASRREHRRQRQSPLGLLYR